MPRGASSCLLQVLCSLFLFRSPISHWVKWVWNHPGLRPEAEKPFHNGAFPKGCVLQKHQSARIAEPALKHCRSIRWPVCALFAELLLSLKTPKPPKQAFLRPNWRKKRFLQPLRNKSPRQGHGFHDIYITKIALLVAGKVNEQGRFPQTDF